MTESRQAGILEKVAAVSASAIIISAVVYWGIQIAGVFEFLELAYG
ncbi:MAG: hypothetical protein KKD00_08660 [Gammaproteobacteria bacterium]|nr:hypothetical protein [Gammaproteobacteria bacterium]